MYLFDPLDRSIAEAGSGRRHPDRTRECRIAWYSRLPAVERIRIGDKGFSTRIRINQAIDG